MSETIENAKLLLAKWRNDAEVLEKAHYWSATYSRMYNYCLGIPLVIITTFTASDIFVKLSKFVETNDILTNGMYALAWIVIPLSILSPILAGLQTFLRFPERAMQHREAAIKFGGLKNEIELIMNFLPTENELCKKVETIQLKYASIIQESPSAGTISLWREEKTAKSNEAAEEAKKVKEVKE